MEERVLNELVKLYFEDKDSDIVTLNKDLLRDINSLILKLVRKKEQIQELQNEIKIRAEGYQELFKEKEELEKQIYFLKKEVKFQNFNYDILLKEKVKLSNKLKENKEEKLKSVNVIKNKEDIEKIKTFEEFEKFFAFLISM